MNDSASSSSPAAGQPVRLRKPRQVAALCIFGLLAVLGLGAWQWYRSTQWKRSLSLAKRALSAGDTASGNQYLQQAIRTAPTSSQLPRQVAELAIQQGLLSDVENWLGQVPATADGTKSQLVLAAADKAIELADVARAERILETIPAEDRQYSAAQQKMIELSALLCDQSDLRMRIGMLDTQQPDRKWDARLLLAYILGARGSWLREGEREWLEKAHRQDPANLNVAMGLAQHLLNIGDNASADRLLGEATGDLPTVRIGILQFRRLVETGQLKKAQQDFLGMPSGVLRTSYRVDPRFNTILGQLSFALGDLEETRRTLAAAHEQDPLDPAPMYLLARLARRTGSEELAEKHFQHADLLAKLSRLSASYNPAVPPEQQAELVASVAKLATQLDFPKLAYRLLKSIPLDNPNLSTSARLASDLSKNPAALEPISVFGPGKSSTPRPKPDIQLSADENKAAFSSTKPYGANPQFWDIAESVGLKFQFRGAPAPRDNPLMINLLGGGVAPLDFDGDGWPDLFFSQGTPLPVPAKSDDGIGRLFWNRRGSSFEDVTSAAKLSSFGFGQGSAAGDFDNDGFVDLLVCEYGSIRLHRNNGDGTFREITSSSGLSDSGWCSSATFGDFDRDGDLDLLVVHYVTKPWPSEGCCLPLSFRPTQNAIWENLGDGRFADRSKESGIQSTVTRMNTPSRGDPGNVDKRSEPGLAQSYGLAVWAEDFDNDGWIDLYLANDMSPNFLFRNLGRASVTGQSPFSFQEVGIAAGVATNGKGEVQASMGLACADVDGNGFPDLFVTNFENETNTLYRNHGQMSFSDDTASAGLLEKNPPRMGWGCQFIDSRGRGELDLFMVNSHLRVESPQRPAFYSNARGRFREFKLEAPYFQSRRMGRGVAVLDWNRDFRADLVVTYLEGNVSLLNNESAIGNCFEVDLVGRNGNRDAAGATVTVHYGDRSRHYRISRCGGFLAANDKRLSIGLDTFKEARWEITWPSGLRQVCGLAKSGEDYLVVEGQQPLERLRP